MMNRRELLAGGAGVAAALAAPASYAQGSEFDLYIEQLRPRALAAGVRREFSTPRPLISVLTMALSLRRRGKANSAGHFGTMWKGRSHRRASGLAARP